MFLFYDICKQTTTIKLKETKKTYHKTALNTKSLDE